MQRSVIKLLRPVHSRRQVGATDHLVCTGQATSCKSLCVYWRDFMKIFVSVTEFCRSSMSQKVKSYRICGTCCGNKILLPRQTLEGICHCDVSLQCDPTTSCATCTHGVICCCNLSPSLFRRPSHLQTKILLSL